jgi:hypothetical protein
MKPFPSGLVGEGPLNGQLDHPNMTPPQWGYLKDQVFARSPENVDQLREFITEEFNDIPQDMIRRACQSVTDRCRLCIELGGKQLKLHKG